MHQSKCILQEKNWLSSEDCEYLILLYKTYWCPENGEDYNGNRALYYTAVCASAEIESYLRAIAQRLRRRVEDFFGVEGLVLEALFLAALRKGGSHEPHADNEKYMGGKWVPNHVPQRAFTAILYLNSNFSGGDLRFPQHKLRVSPQRGLLVAFPSGHEFVHAVDRVTSGTRYSMPVWFACDERFGVDLTKDQAADVR